ncbi:MAG: site-2 protease family protein [Candidatus Flexifilum sp.]
MLNEPASSIDDRPLPRDAQRIDLPNGNTAQEVGPRRLELRSLVGSVLLIEREYFPRSEWSSDRPPRSSRRPASLFEPPEQDHQADEPLAQMGEALMALSGDSRYIASFEGRLMHESAEAYDMLDRQFRPLDYLALFRERKLPDGTIKHVIHVISGRPQPRPRPWLLNAILLIATFVSVLIVGTTIAIGEIELTNPALAARLANNFFAELWRGLPYAISILLILGAHELGHYFAARHHRLAVTLPYFIPAPFISPLGTFGAFIQLREPIRNRNVLLDVGAAGPLAGLTFAIPILFIGLATSIVSPIQPGASVEGNSLLYALAKTIVFGRFLPDGQVDVLVNQLAWAGWTGLLVTALNLIPLGQLDGGHILFSLIGDAARKLYFPLLGVLALLVFFVSDVWLLWLILLLFFGRLYASPLDMITPLTPRRRWIAYLALVVLIVTFIPAPFTVAEGGSSVPTLRDAVLHLLPVVPALLWTRRR